MLADLRAFVFRAAFKPEPFNHARLDDLRVQGEQDKLRVEAVARHERSLDPAFDRKRKLDRIDAGEGVRPDHAIGKDFRRRAVGMRRRIFGLFLVGTIAIPDVP